MYLKITRTRPNVTLPKYESAGAAGLDLRARLDEEVVLAPGARKKIPTGLAIELPEGYMGLLMARSGLSAKNGVALANGVGLIDSDYRGEILVSLINHSDEAFTVRDGERVAQLVVAPVSRAELVECASLEETERGAGGFGSTGD